MKTLKLIYGGMWAVFALCFWLLTFIKFEWFVLLMALGSSGIAVVCFFEHHWSDDDRSW